MRGEVEFEERVRSFTRPSRSEIVKAKRHILELLSDGSAHRTFWLQRQVLELENIPREPDREKLTIAEEASVATVVVPDHPMLARRRLILASIEALAELQAMGVVLPADDKHLGPEEEDRSSPVPSADEVPYDFMGHGSGVRGLKAGRPLLADAYMLVHAYRDREAWFLDVDIFVADLSALTLDSRTIRSLQEALDAFRRGLFLATASLIGAAVEGVWYTVGEMLRTRDSGLAKALDNSETAKVQRRVAEHLGPSKDELLAHAGLMRDLRNYGIHPRPTETEQLERYFTEETCALLLVESYRYLQRLAEFAEKFAKEERP